MSLANKVALVTGGAKNLGAQTARELAGQGASLALHYNSASSQKDAQALEAELRQKHPNIKVAFYQGDLTSAAAVIKLFKDTLRDFGHIDIVVNTVGKVLKKPITDISEEEYDSMFAYVPSIHSVYCCIVDRMDKYRINSKAAFFILKEAANHVTDGGKIITIVTALLGAFTGFYTLYAGSKAPVEHFTRGVCKELQGRRISVNNIAPGPMDTRMFPVSLTRLPFFFRSFC
jgi:NAD(P)-dependent dehydrogenase (short-subunit alcohol dehydrogenase family)